jgi:hypothetical protein
MYVWLRWVVKERIVNICSELIHSNTWKNKRKIWKDNIQMDFRELFFVSADEGEPLADCHVP